jgi:hypothetical protein
MSWNHPGNAIAHDLPVVYSLSATSEEEPCEEVAGEAECGMVLRALFHRWRFAPEVAFLDGL